MPMSHAHDAMPRAFLITHRRYRKDSGLDLDLESVSESSLRPDLESRTPRAQLQGNSVRNNADRVGVAVRLAVTAGSWVSECPDELFNLTQLAEVSLAAAAAQGHHFRSTRISSGSQSHGAHGCSECGKRYSTASNLARHRQTHRSLAGQLARGCPTCGKLYVSTPAYAMHVRTHAQACRCEFCGKTFSRPWLLQGHVRTHTGEKPFKCAVCAKAFADKSNLRAHQQTHSDAKPHVCARCGKAFALKSYLYKHEEASCLRPGSLGTPALSHSVTSSPPSSPDTDTP